MILALLLLVIGHALFDACLIAAGKTIYHAREAALYGMAALALGFCLERLGWSVVLAVALRAALFDPLLNYFRRLPLTYEGDTTNPRRSLVDKLEDATGIPIAALRIFYLAAAATLYAISTY